jgi:hypothetical protein
MASFEFEKTGKTVNFSSAINSPGDLSGTGNPYPLFNITGDIVCVLYSIPTDDIDNGGILSVGYEGNQCALINTYSAHTFNPQLAKTGRFLETQVISDKVINQYLTEDDIKTGSIRYYLVWAPLSIGAMVEAQ